MGRERFEDELIDHVDMVYNLARRLSDNTEEAEDLMQDTALAGWQAWQRQGPPHRFGPWLATICLNLARSRYRRVRARPIEHLTPDAGQGVPAQGRPVDFDAVARVEAAAVHVQLAAWPHHQREAVVMMDLCGFSAAEVASILDVLRNTVLSRVHRGHLALAILLADWVEAR